ncbi:hypothetical protein J4438_00830 [Candidatus Woesearchaeota archaeon]|nr:hypothetical protein [Candidatus Woesearchaeota archaeon]
MKKLILIVILLVCADLVESATLQGNIYDFELNKAKNVMITVDSIPKQTIISTDSFYSLELNPGNYKLTAQQLVQNITIASTTEEINIKDNGIYKLDLILFPELEDPPEDIDLNELDENNPDYVLIFSILAILLIITFVIIKKKKKDVKQIDIEKNETDIVLDFIKKNDGRTTQKDIRKSLMMSEAKLSLIITELEHKELVKKIKKGRGNIIILNK